MCAESPPRNGRLGAKYSMREFHDRVLRYGNVPPALIERELVREWR